MDFELSDEHEMLRSSVREFIDREIIPKIKEYDRNEEFLPPLDIMGKMGLLGICFPEKYGGAGMDYLALALACEELERGDISLRTVLSVHVALTSCTIYQWGNDEQKEKYLIPQNNGKKIGTTAMTEPSCGSDVANISTRAEIQVFCPEII
ncbi:MAG: acyl-CoA dehydrogenase family protein, partial [Promethearchaeota archaeon]